MTNNNHADDMLMESSQQTLFGGSQAAQTQTTNINSQPSGGGLDMVDIDAVAQSGLQEPVASQPLTTEPAIDMSMHPSGIIPTLQYVRGSY